MFRKNGSIGRNWLPYTGMYIHKSGFQSTVFGSRYPSDNHKNRRESHGEKKYTRPLMREYHLSPHLRKAMAKTYSMSTAQWKKNAAAARGVFANRQ
jgi:hypothetical protein